MARRAYGPVRNSRIVIERLQDGRYRASRDADIVEWDPRGAAPPTRALRASPTFLHDLARLKLGRGCASCGYIEVEHYIDGAERAPCNEYVRS